MRYEQFRMMCAATLAAATILTGAATAALAQQQVPGATVVGERAIEDARSVEISYRDLNLAASSGEQILHRRVSGAARSVCGPNDDQMVNRPFSDCVTFARNNALPQIDLAVRRAREIAANGTSSIPLVAIAVVGVR